MALDAGFRIGTFRCLCRSLTLRFRSCIVATSVRNYVKRSFAEMPCSISLYGIIVVHHAPFGDCTLSIFGILSCDSATSIYNILVATRQLYVDNFIVAVRQLVFDSFSWMCLCCEWLQLTHPNPLAGGQRPNQPLPLYIPYNPKHVA